MDPLVLLELLVSIAWGEAQLCQLPHQLMWNEGSQGSHCLSCWLLPAGCWHVCPSHQHPSVGLLIHPSFCVGDTDRAAQTPR